MITHVPMSLFATLSWCGVLGFVQAYFKCHITMKIQRTYDLNEK